jgi:uncharacterized RDD family membrane protein YckC
MWPFRRAEAVENQHICPLCGESAPRRRAVELYGTRVCRRCQRAFANRRAAAWIVDRLIFVSAAFAASAALSRVDPGAAKAAFVVLGWVAFAFRDAHRGRSPGKSVFGLQVVAEGTGEPIDALRSFARNVVLFVPPLPLVAATQIAEGKRIGDGIAGTRVIWTRYAHTRVFS